MKVAVLGCGPAGLLAAHAARMRGAEVDVYALGEASHISGAQYLHSSIPEITDPDNFRYLTYVKVGSADGYAKKAYGESKAQISWDSFVTGEYPAWSLQDAYDVLWQKYEGLITPLRIIPRYVYDLCREYDLVLSSIPLNLLCRNLSHSFHHQPVIYTEEPFIDVNNVIIYNGRDSDKWYRTSKLFGHYATEYAIHQKFTLPAERQGWGKFWEGEKPTHSDCNCFSDLQNFVKIGRFGRWLRGVLTDHTFHQVYERVN